MHVERILSLNNGWSTLTTQKSEEWEEALAVLHTLDDQSIFQLARDSGGYAVDINHFYLLMYDKYQQILTRRHNWTDNTIVSEARITPYSEAPAVKNGVLASIMGLDEVTGGDFAASIYFHVPYYFSLGAIDVAIYFIPSATTIDHFIKLGAKPDTLASIPTEEFCRAEIIKFKALTNPTPVVLAFFSPTAPEEIPVEEATTLKIGEHTIERTIEFAPEYYQAGVGLLSYFGEVLRQKDPNTKTKVRIEQDGRIVRLHIESPTGDIETIEKELDQYALVLSNQAPPESLFEQRMHIMQLEFRLEMAKVELKNTQDLKQLMDGFYSQQVRDIQQQLVLIKDLVATQLLHGKTVPIVIKQASSHVKMQSALLTRSEILFKSLIQEADGNQQLIDALDSLHQHLLVGTTSIDTEEQLEKALSTIKGLKLEILLRLHSHLEGAAYRAAAGSAMDWVIKWIEQYR